MKLFCCNTLWFISCFSSWINFYISTFFVKSKQILILKNILKKNYRSQYLNNCKSITDFQKIKISEASDYSNYIEKIIKGHKNILTTESINILQPTSGSTSNTKLIPYTATLQDQFNKAIKPWMFNLYINTLSLLFGKHYWSISSCTAYDSKKNTSIKIGFADDTQYLAPFQKKIASILFAVPSEISQVHHIESFEYLTLLFLVREKNIRFISIWHPSFLTTLLDRLPLYYDQIIDDIKTGNITLPTLIDNNLLNKFRKHNVSSFKRAKELNAININDKQNLKLIWPKLKVISCWTESSCMNALNDLKEIFLKVYFQPKGIIATEGIFSFPFGLQDKRVAATNSHYLEFIDSSSKKLIPLWELEIGKTYSLVITTGGGLYRYKMHDIIEVTGFYNATPCFIFKGRDNVTSDLVGEKLNIQHVEDAFHSSKFNFKFAIIAPRITKNDCGYVLYYEPNKQNKPDHDLLRNNIEDSLRKNYYYLHAVKLGQLKPLRLFQINEDANNRYINYFMENGYRRGDIKLTFLSTETNWDKIFNGEFLN